MNALGFDVGAIAQMGKRERQEDSFCVSDCDGSDRPIGELPCVLVAVADGLGGHSSGNVASQEVVRSLTEVVRQGFGQGDNADLLLCAIRMANDQIRSLAETDPHLDGMGSTAVAAIVDGCRVDWISVGDSHLAILSESTYHRLNTPHRPMPSENLDVAAPTNVLLSCLNGSVIPQIELSDGGVTLAQGEYLLLASDGIEVLDESQLSECAARSQSAQDLADRIGAAISERNQPDQDNATVVIVRPLQIPEASPGLSQ
jgi:protein phosphatase